MLRSTRNNACVDKDYGNIYDGFLCLRVLALVYYLAKDGGQHSRFHWKMQVVASANTSINSGRFRVSVGKPADKMPYPQLNTCTNKLSNSSHGSMLGVPHAHLLSNGASLLMLRGTQVASSAAML